MKEEFEPNILGFLCNWCSYAGADLAGTSRIKYPPNIKSIKLLKNFLNDMGVEPERVRFEYVSASEGQKFAKVVTEFVEELKKLGPSPIKRMD